MKWWMYIAFKQLFPSGRGVSFFAAMSVLGVALGVLALFGTQSIMGGFHEQIGVKMRDTTGDVIVSVRGSYLGDVDAIEKAFEAEPSVAKVESIIGGPVMLRYGQTPAFPMLRSFDTFKNDSALPLREKGYISDGQDDTNLSLGEKVDISSKILDELDDGSIIVGTQFAHSLNLFIGSEVSVYSPTMIDMLNEEEVPMPARLKVIGYLNTGFNDMDANVAIVSLRRMRDLYGFGDNAAQQLILKLKDGFLPSEVAADLNVAYSRDMLNVQSWEDSNGAFLEVVKMEKTMMSIIIMLVILVASFSICISLYTSVLRKTREIGLISAMGASPMQVIACYVFQGLLIGILGALLGLVLSFAILECRDYILGFVLGERELIDVYYLDKLPVKYDLFDAISTCAFAVILCTLAGLIPALIASRLKASEAMRNE